MNPYVGKNTTLICFTQPFLLMLKTRFECSSWSGRKWTSLLLCFYSVELKFSFRSHGHYFVPPQYVQTWFGERAATYYWFKLLNEAAKCLPIYASETVWLISISCVWWSGMSWKSKYNQRKVISVIR